MTRRTILAGVLAMVAPGAAFGQGLAIDHNEVRCIVAGKFPRFDACFNPSSEVARARVYFRAEGGPHWYFVDMRTSTPCFSTVLPKPKKSLKRMNYYLEVVNRGFEESRTAEFNPDIVTDQGQCRKDIPAAPFVQSASVTVGVAAGAPAVPAGFAAAGLVGVGGVSTTAVVAGVVGGGAAVAGGAIIVGSSSSATTTPAVTTPTSITTPTVTVPTPVTTPSPTLPPATTPNLPPIGDFRINPDPPKGIAPLLVKLNLCGSLDPDGDSMRFVFDYGDGTKDQGSCRSEHTYTSFFKVAGRSLGSAAPPSPPSPSFTSTFIATACVDDRTGLEDHRVCRSYDVDVNPNCSSDTVAPQVSITNPANGSTYGDFGQPLPVPFRAYAIDNVAIEFVEYLDQPLYGPSVLLGASNNRGNGFAFDYSPASQCSPVRAVAKAVDVCGNTTFSAAIDVNVSVGGCGSPAPAVQRFVWVSQLDVAGGRGQVILNGRSVSFPGAGRSNGMGDAMRGTNRIEAVLAEGRGQGGLWQFDLGESDVEAGSLTVVAGEVAELKPQAITFRLKGQPGERVVFTFRPRP